MGTGVSTLAATGCVLELREGMQADSCPRARPARRQGHLIPPLRAHAVRDAMRSASRAAAAQPGAAGASAQPGEAGGPAARQGGPPGQGLMAAVETAVESVVAAVRSRVAGAVQRAAAYGRDGQTAWRSGGGGDAELGRESAYAGVGEGAQAGAAGEAGPAAGEAGGAARLSTDGLAAALTAAASAELHLGPDTQADGGLEGDLQRLMEQALRQHAAGAVGAAEAGAEQSEQAGDDAAEAGRPRSESAGAGWLVEEELGVPAAVPENCLAVCSSPSESEQVRPRRCQRRCRRAAPGLWPWTARASLVSACARQAKAQPFCGVSSCPCATSSPSWRAGLGVVCPKLKLVRVRPSAGAQATAEARLREAFPLLAWQRADAELLRHRRCVSCCVVSARMREQPEQVRKGGGCACTGWTACAACSRVCSECVSSLHPLPTPAPAGPGLPRAHYAAAAAQH